MLAAFNADTTRAMEIINFADCIMDGCYFSPDYGVWKVTKDNCQFLLTGTASSLIIFISKELQMTGGGAWKYILFKDKCYTL